MLKTGASSQWPLNLAASRVALETSSLSSGRKRAMSVSEQPEEDAVCSVRSCASSGMMDE